MEGNRTDIIRVYVTEETKEDVQEKAEENGMAASAYCRHKIKTKVLGDGETA